MVLRILHGTQDILHGTHDMPTVLNIPMVLTISPTVLHTRYTGWIYLLFFSTRVYDVFKKNPSSPRGKDALDTIRKCSFANTPVFITHIGKMSMDVICKFKIETRLNKDLSSCEVYVKTTLKMFIFYS